MRKFLIASHGKFASGLKSSIKILTGKTNISTIDEYLDGSKNKTNIDVPLNKFLDSLEEKDIGIIFTDLIGGSVNREVMLKIANTTKNVFVITSVNLPTVLSVVLDGGEMSEKHLNEIINKCPVQISKLPKKQDSLSDEDCLLYTSKRRQRDLLHLAACSLPFQLKQLILPYKEGLPQLRYQ